MSKEFEYHYDPVEPSSSNSEAKVHMLYTYNFTRPIRAGGPTVRKLEITLPEGEWSAEQVQSIFDDVMEAIRRNGTGR